MKYVITDHNKIAMGSGTYHKDLAHAITGAVKGAAHIDLVKGEIYGDSVGYNTKATQEDADYLSQYFGVPVKLNAERKSN